MNASDVKQINEAKKRDRLNQDQAVEDTRWMLGSINGRRFIWKYLEFCGVFRSSWDNSAKIHFNEGVRNVGLRIIDDITQADPMALANMMKEANDKQYE